MRYVRLSVTYADDPRILAAGDAGELMFLRCLAYAGKHETDGNVPRTVAERFAKRPRKVLETLVNVGLFEPVPEGFKITNWDKWQTSKAALTQVRESGAERQRRHRTKKATAGNATGNGVTRARSQEVEVKHSGTAIAVPAADAADESAGSLIAEWIEHSPTRPPGRVVGHVGRELATMLAEGQPFPVVRSGLAEWARSNTGPSALPSFVHRAGSNGNSKRSNSTTDQRVIAGLELVEHFELLDRAAQ